jgi:predicted small secreted protein
MANIEVKKLFKVIGALVVVSMLLTACATATRLRTQS